MANQNVKPNQLNLNNEEETQMNKEAYEQNQTYSFKIGKLTLLWMWRENEHGLMVVNKDGEIIYSVTWESTVKGIKGLGEYLKLQAEQLIKAISDALAVSWDKAKSTYQKLLSLFNKDTTVQIDAEDVKQGDYIPSASH